jgi:tRNA-splicing ligase RtcB
MKKIKLRGKELKRIGFTNDQAISLAINLVSKKYKRSDKPEALELLKKINIEPESYLDDLVFGDLAQFLSKKKSPQKKKPVLHKTAFDFKIYGEENIDPAAIQ